MVEQEVVGLALDEAVHRAELPQPEHQRVVAGIAAIDVDGYDLPHKPFMAARVGYAVDGPAFQVYGAFPDEHGIDFVCGDRRKARLFKLVGIPARQLAAQLYLLKLGGSKE